MPQRPLSPYRRHVRHLTGRPIHARFRDSSVRYRPNRLMRMAYAVRRPCVCYGCICLTPDERARQRRVFALTRAWHKMLEAEARGSA